MHNRCLKRRRPRSPAGRFPRGNIDKVNNIFVDYLLSLLLPTIPIIPNYNSRYQYNSSAKMLVNRKSVWYNITTIVLLKGLRIRYSTFKQIDLKLAHNTRVLRTLPLAWTAADRKRHGKMNTVQHIINLLLWMCRKCNRVLYHWRELVCWHIISY